jgi:hypothetical protein
MEPLPLYRIFVPIGLVVGLTILAIIRKELLLRSIVIGIWLMVGYAMLQDQVSARLCVEYFTIFHQPIPGITDPTLIGMGWGFLGSWYGGAIMGVSAGLTSSLGPKPPLPLSVIVRGMLGVMLTTGLVTALAGYATYVNMELFGITLDETVVGALPPENRKLVFVVANYHLVAYGISILGSIILCLVLARLRHLQNQ